jgi:hypothetical protein
MYVMIPVRKETKDLVEAYKKSIGAKSYDEAIARNMAEHLQSAWDILSPLAGKFPGLGPFVRDKSERDLGRFLRDNRSD